MLCNACQTDSDAGLACVCGELICGRCFDLSADGRCRCLPLSNLDSDSLFPTYTGLPWGGRVPWAHQERALSLIDLARSQGHRRIVLAAPTGSGKTAVAAELARRTAAAGGRVGLFTNRKLLTSQAADTLDGFELEFGMLAAGHGGNRGAAVQVVSVPTLHSRAVQRGLIGYPPFNLCLIDEAHSQKGEMAQAVINHYSESGALVVGLTATPVGLSSLYTHLVQAAVNSELRRCGALVPCHVFAPDEPDLQGVTRQADGEYNQREAAEAAVGKEDDKPKRVVVFGNVFRHWKRLNPSQLPTLLFAPGVAESEWFVREFLAQGIPAAHMDAQTSNAERKRLQAESKAGKLPIISSYGILREGVDMPWIRHGILVQPCGGLSTYLQIVGRLLRAAPGKTSAILQDHAGAWWRHGSPNADRHWRLSDTNQTLMRERMDSLSGKPKPDGSPPEPQEPGISCPKCGGVRMRGPECPHCGWKHARSVRWVRMTNGQLRKVQGDPVKFVSQEKRDEKTWVGCLFAAHKSGRTCKQARAHFKAKTGGRDVPQGRLLPKDNEWNCHPGMVFPFLFAGKRRAQ